MNEDYKIQTNSEEVKRRQAEIEAIELSPEMEKAAANHGIYLLKHKIWQERRGNNDSMKAVSNDLKKD